MPKFIEREDGLYEDKGGYFVKVQKSNDDLKFYATPAFCPVCTNMMYNIDTRWFTKWGVCLNCAISYLEDRKLPDNLNTIQDYQVYAKEKFSSKKK